MAGTKSIYFGRDESLSDNHIIVICNCVFPDQSRPVRCTWKIFWIGMIWRWCSFTDLSFTEHSELLILLVSYWTLGGAMLRSTGIQGRGVAMRVPIITALVILLSKLDIDLSYMCSVQLTSHVHSVYRTRTRQLVRKDLCRALQVTHLCCTELVLSF